MSEVRIGLIGAGMMGMVHAENIARRVPGARLAAVADTMPGRAEECAGLLGVERAYTDAAAMLDDGGLDAVVVSTPGHTHAAVIEAAAERGLHILTEKPLERTLERADAALAAVARTGVKLMVAFNRRFDPGISSAYNKVRSGDIGTLVTIHIVELDPARDSGVRPPGDIFLDTAIHGLDTARWLAGAEAVEVSAAGGCIGELDDPDYAVTTVRFGNGVVATVNNNRVSGHGYDQRLEVCGTRALASAGPAAPPAAVPGEPVFVPRWGAAYVAELRTFVECVHGDTPVPVDGNDGRTALVLALAAHRSYLEQRPVQPTEIVA